MDNPVTRRWTATPSTNLPNPEDDLTEWTNKIKAIQRAVDDDEEVEQQRLEEEIRASRLARSRRSMGMVPSVTGSDSIPRPLSRGYRERVDSPTSPSSESREKNQSDALRKLMGDSNDQPSSSSPARIRTTSMVTESLNRPSLAAARFSSSPSAQASSGKSAMSSASSGASASSKPEPISLAAFMGGSATGPRLRKHAPQQDAHDPTKFTQVTSTSVTTPHPIFGRGGVAMPGLVGKGRGLGAANPRETTQVGPERKESYLSYSRKDVVPPTKVDDNRKSFGDIPKTSPPVPSKPVSISLSRSVSSGVQSEVPSRQQSTPPITPPPPKTATPVTPRPIIQPQYTSSAPSITMASLARPIQPDLRPSPQGPSIPSSKSPSPAFLRAPVQKDLTPSLSRLQGRGFVQSFVKKSDDLEGVVSATPSPERLPSSGKRNSVHDRWQPLASAAPSPTTAVPLRKTKTFDLSPSPTSPSPAKEVSKPAITREQSLPPPITAPKPKFISAEVPSPSIPGLGSANTMISYIKPTKTGDAPATDNASSVAQSVSTFEERAGLDEFGVRTRTRSAPSSAVGAGFRQSPFGQEKANKRSEIPPGVGKPLNHLTKGRAKKPRKGTGNEVAREARAATEHPEPLTSSSDVANDFQEGTIRASPRTRQAIPSHETTSATDVRLVAEVGPKQMNNMQGENVRQMIGSWGAQAPIGVKQISKRPPPLREPQAENRIELTRHALPGLAEFPPTPPMTVRQEAKPPPSPSRHTRIPSTGSRATVMDVAQALALQEEQARGSITSPGLADIPKVEVTTIGNAQADEDENGDEVSPINVKSVRSQWERTITPSAMQAERRRSSYEKYSAIMMPPLKEEKTPTPSPAATLSKATVAPVLTNEERASDDHRETDSTSANFQNDEIIRIEPDTSLLPAFSIRAIWDERVLTQFKPNHDLKTLSVEEFLIAGGTSTAIQNDINILYDSEIVAVVLRAKSKSTGLVSTQVWAWKGTNTVLGEREERRLNELAKQFNTSLTNCGQFAESPDFIYALGGTLCIRQGARSVWSIENSAMHVVRSWKGCLIIDEADLDVRNLCSGYSYCISVLDTLWVWHGRGSTDTQRQSARSYATKLIPAGDQDGTKNVVEVEEGNEDDMFWMFLGEPRYAMADYWKWRKQSYDPKGTEIEQDPRIWRINTSGVKLMIEELRYFTTAEPDRNVFIINLVFEIFIVVGISSREGRSAIRLALAVAQSMSLHTARDLPFKPSVHVVIMPSQLPLDLLAVIRGIREDTLCTMAVPDHMNILTVEEAETHLQCSVWARNKLQDASMLPLGIGVPFI